MANDFFNDLGAALSRTAQDLGDRMGAMYEAGKTRGRISGEEQARNKLLYDLGTIAYQRFLSGECGDEEMVQICRRIRQHEAKIDRLRREAEQMSARRFCPMCGRQAEPGASFCPNCGTSLNPVMPQQQNPEQPMETEPQEAAEPQAEAADTNQAAEAEFEESAAAEESKAEEADESIPENSFIEVE